MSDETKGRAGGWVKNEEGYIVGVRDQIEADWMAARTPKQLEQLGKMTDERFCKVLQTDMMCGLARMNSKERIRAKRENIATRKAKLAKYAIDPLQQPGRPKTAKGKV